MSPFTPALLLYLPHLAEEALTGMHDDPLIVNASAFLARSPLLSRFTERHAVYLTFQATLALLLVAVLLVAVLLVDLGGKWRALVLAALGLALVGEAHHLIRFVVTHHASSGLVTSLPMPLLGVFILTHLPSLSRT